MLSSLEFQVIDRKIDIRDFFIFLIGKRLKPRLFIIVC